MTQRTERTSVTHSCAVECLQQLDSVVAARVAIDGTLVFGNTGFCRLLGFEPDARPPVDVRGHFLNPSFPQLLAVQGDKGQPVYVGIVNLADKHDRVCSLIGTVHRDRDHMTVVAEYDVAEMERLNAHVIDLNMELAEVQRSLARANRTLQDSSYQLKVLTGGVLDMYEAQRRVLAYELHEELAQALAAITINLRSPLRSANMLCADLDAQAVHMVANALERVRRLAFTLRPAALDDLGLMPALRWLAQQTASQSGLAIQVSATGASDRLEPHLETVCYRMVEEALSNVLRHATATTVAIVVDQGASQLRLSVQDNGAGFDPVLKADRMAARGGIGLLAMRERAARVGGQLDILSAPGAGTTVNLRCPLAQQASHST